MLEKNWVSDVRLGSLDFQQGLDCRLTRNQFISVTLRFENASQNMKVENNHWTSMKDGQPSIKVRNDSILHLGEGNQVDGKDFSKTIEREQPASIR